jgi:hypothetical protein
MGVTRAGERVLAIANFSGCSKNNFGKAPKESSFRRDAETSTRDACATQRMPLPLVAGSIVYLSARAAR